MDVDRNCVSLHAVFTETGECLSVGVSRLKWFWLETRKRCWKEEKEIDFYNWNSETLYWLGDSFRGYIYKGRGCSIFFSSLQCVIFYSLPSGQSSLVCKIEISPWDRKSLSPVWEIPAVCIKRLKWTMEQAICEREPLTTMLFISKDVTMLIVKCSIWAFPWHRRHLLCICKRMPSGMDQDICFRECWHPHINIWNGTWEEAGYKCLIPYLSSCLAPDHLTTILYLLCPQNIRKSRGFLVH